MLWLMWNLLCRPDLPQTQRDPPISAYQMLAPSHPSLLPCLTGSSLQNHPANAWISKTRSSMNTWLAWELPLSPRWGPQVMFPSSKYPSLGKSLVRRFYCQFSGNKERSSPHSSPLPTWMILDLPWNQTNQTFNQTVPLQLVYSWQSKASCFSENRFTEPETQGSRAFLLSCTPINSFKIAF